MPIRYELGNGFCLPQLPKIPRKSPLDSLGDGGGRLRNIEPRRLSGYPCAGCKSGCLAPISAPFRPIAMAMSSQMSQNRVSTFQIFASARIVRQPPSGFHITMSGRIESKYATMMVFIFLKRAA